MISFVLLLLLLSACATDHNALPTSVVVDESSPQTTPITMSITITPSPRPGSGALDPIATIDDTTEREEINHAGGFAFIRPSGWEALSSNDERVSFSFVTPTDSDPDHPDRVIIIYTAPITELLTSVTPDASLDELLSASVAGNDDITLSHRTNDRIGELSARSARLTGVAEDIGTLEGRIILARLDDKRVFQMIGFAPVAQWDRTPFQTIQDTMRFFEPVPTIARPNHPLDLPRPPPPPRNRGNLPIPLLYLLHSSRFLMVQ